MNELPNITASSYTTSAVSGNELFLNQQSAQARHDAGLHKILQAVPAITPEKFSMRIVKVFIADPNENIPLEKRILYSGDEKLTDLTDQELFFEVPIASLLADHNAMRAKTVDKKQADKFGRDIFLEPVRIKDLKMVVVAIASF